MSYLLSSCFISDATVFFVAFLGPIFAILLFNVVIFVLVIGVLIRNTLSHSKTLKNGNGKITVRLLISITGVMFLFGLTWLFGALTVTGFGSSGASTAFQVIFVMLNAFQGFFIFLFFCVFSKDARESWLEVFTCGRYHSKYLHPSQAKYVSPGAPQKKVQTASTNSANSNLGTPSTSNFSVERSSKIPLTSAAEENEKPAEGSPEIHETELTQNSNLM